MADSTSSPSDLYDQITTTAQRFLHALNPDPIDSNRVNAARILANLSPDFRMSWGHATFVRGKPALQGAKSGPEFVEHMRAMTPGLETWRNEITQRVVDPVQRTAVVRADFWMVPRGEGTREERTVLNEILFTFEMDARGEKVVAAVEFVDPVATAEIGRLMAAERPSYA
jgi:hypothetical protein